MAGTGTATPPERLSQPQVPTDTAAAQQLTGCRTREADARKLTSHEVLILQMYLHTVTITAMHVEVHGRLTRTMAETTVHAIMWLHALYACLSTRT